MKLKQYEIVRVVKMLHPAEYYDGWKLNKRPPRLGDVGTIVEILNAPNLAPNYVVEAISPNGIPDWLGDFLEEELELIS